MTTDLYEIQVAAGPIVLDTEALVGVVVDDTYLFDASQASLTVVDDFEVTGTGYARLAADARVELDDGVWTVWLDDVTTTDLSDVPARAGIVWVRPNDDLVAFTADPGGAVDPYAPTYPSGLFDYPVESIAAVLDGLRTDVDAALAATGDLDATAPVTITEGTIALSIGAGLAVDGGNLVATPTAAWGEFTEGSIPGIVTRSDGALVKLSWGAGSVVVMADPPGPVLLGTVDAAHRPPSDVQFATSWVSGGLSGGLAVLVDDPTGDVLGTPGGVWVMDTSGTLSDTDDVTPLFSTVDWWIA